MNFTYPSPMRPIHSAVPPEILELFVDELGRNSAKSKNWRALQACALVSREFRNRAHHHLFSSISFVQRPCSSSSQILARIWKFRELVHSGMDLPGLTSVLYHLRSLTIVTDGSNFEAYSILEKEDVAELLQDVQIYSKSIQGVSIRGSSYPLLWAQLTPDFRQAFNDLCLSANMTTLNLENIVGVPNSFLEGTNIRHVHFHFIEFEKPQLAFGILGDDEYIYQGQLESIDIDYTFPFPQADMLRPDVAYASAMQSYKAFFSHVKTLRYVAHRSNDLQHFMAIARSISLLETLELELPNPDNAFLRGTPLDLPLQDLPCLQSLAIRHKTLVNIGMRHPLFTVMAILKNVSAPKSLRTVELSFDVSAHPPWTTPTHFFPDPKSWGTLDAVLTRGNFGSVREVILNLKYCPLREKPWTFDEEIFSERCYNIFKGVFPLLSNSKSKRLVLNIAFCDTGGNKGRHEAATWGDSELTGL